ncbi:MAG: T9SS type A sorting domain-containing protein [Bacteroidales bacterium]|nr:T9SS type A sorting domain-containing protein [Bacteroidales bacterium]
MKQFLLLFLILGISSFSFAQNDTIAGWTFPQMDESSLFANIGTDENIQIARLTTESNDRPIIVQSLHEDIVATTKQWDNFTSKKYWHISVAANDYTNISISSDQRSTDAIPGPEFFKIQYKLESQEWKDLENSALSLANDWETGVTTELSLPEDCNNYPGEIKIRWITTADTVSNGEFVDAEGISFIKNIIIKGEYSPANINPILVGWEFTSLFGTFDPNPNHGIEANMEFPLQAFIEEVPNPLTITTGGLGYLNGCASISGWDQDENKKYWMVELHTLGYTTIELSSRQKSNSAGPASFEIQYRIGENDWQAIENSDITVDSEWEAGAINRLLLPEECEDSEEIVAIRWIMKGNEAVDADAIDPSAKSFIDNIYFYGYSTTNQDEFSSIEFKVFPNPCENFINISTDKEIVSVCIFDLSGRLIKNMNSNEDHMRINLSEMNSGVYIMQIEETTGRISTKKFIKK